MEPLQILYLEDNSSDADLIRSRLDAEEDLHTRIFVVNGEKPFIKALETEKLDLILLDFLVPGFDGLTALKLARDQVPDVPVIIISGNIGEEIAIETLKQGATDYVLKQRLSRLAPAIRRALRENEEHRKRQDAESALRASEASYRAIFNNTGTATVIVDSKLTVQLANEEFAKMTGFAREKIEGKKQLAEFICEEDRKRLENCFSFGDDLLSLPRHSEICLHSDGEKTISVVMTLARIPATEDAVVSMLDISERKQAEQQLQNSLQEKDVLLKEIHHRVKNNLQIINSLLSLQNARLTGEKEGSPCNDCRDRIRSMAIVHEQLYQSTDFTKINIKEYISRVVLNLFRSFEVGHRIRYELSLSDTCLGIQDAIPLGLVINELTTNCLKHAFPGDRHGLIVFELNPLDEKQIELIIRDNGVGLPESVKLEDTQSFGLHLIKLLIEQVKGKVSILRKDGTEFKITFPGDVP